MMRSFVVHVAMLLVFAHAAWTYPNGISGQTTAGCTCHSTSPSSATSLSLSGPTTVTPGSTSTFTLTLQNSSRPSAGFDLAIVNSNGQNAGTLGTVSGQLTQIMSGELTHTQPKSLSGGSVSWQFTWQAPSTPGPYTVRAAGIAVNGNGNADANDQWNLLQSVTVTVKGITITAPTPSQILCAGGTVTLQWTSYGISSVVVAISSDGGSSFTPIGMLNSQDGQNSQSFTIPSTLQPGNQYRIRLSDASDNTISSTTQNLTLAAPTSITAHPQNASACEGGTVSFSVTASGSNLSYRWRRNGTDVPGATAATLTIANVTQAQAGSYDCVVSGACGQPVTSNSATLTVNPQTTITAHPQSATVCQGASVTFSVTATGSNLRYQWRKGSTDIAGATSASYTIANVALADTGFYACVVTGDCGAPTSNQAQLQVAIPPAITTQPSAQTRCEGDTLVLTIGVSRTIANAYQWKKNGITLNDGGRIQGTRTATLRIIGLLADDAGSYTVEITNTICQASVTSNAAQVTVTAKPVITAEPESKTVTRGSGVTLSVTASGDGLTYQWYHNNQAIPGATAASYSITNAQDSDTGTYYVTISNSCGSVTSRRVTITVTDQPTPLLELSSATITFPALRIGMQVEARLVLYNRGTALLQVTGATISGTAASVFARMLTVPATIPPGDSLVGSVAFAPTAEGDFTAVLTVASNGGERSLQLVGTARARALTPASARFDTTNVSAQTESVIAVCNQTGVEITVDSVVIEGDDASAFELVPGAWQTQIRLLSPQSSTCPEVPIRFHPVRAGTHRAALTFYCRHRDVAFEDAITLEAEAAEGTSVAEDQTSSISIHPNPATDAATIELGNQRGVIRITDLRGGSVLETAALGSYRWDTTDRSGRTVPAGVYVVSIVLDGGLQVTLPLLIVR
ncbi:MAG: hypothetical protein KatS3mg040_0135 [Candidatus Kapaibacterium sp.]|nr:MAG: hypothetical protein KatS3mg040_0135 [Candidatus Kapabacteria bacterium]